MVAYVVEALDDVSLIPGSPIDGMDLMSPFVWGEGARLRMLVRALRYPLGATDPTGVVYAAESHDGLRFTIDPKPAIMPGPDEVDAGGCEDPTVLPFDGGGYAVFYTGVDAQRSQGSLLVAEGNSVETLVKRAVLLKAPPGEGNIKEATIAQTAKGDWRLFYEYAANQASRIGVAGSDAPHGPWIPLTDPFGIREGSWDDWHLSTGPIVAVPGQDPVMFYNGATADARWRIGWVSFDPDFTRVTGRGVEPMLMPPPPEHRDSTDIAFAASTVVEGDLIQLYYSLEDRRLCRATVRRY